MLNLRPDDLDVITIQQVELGVLGPLQVRQFGLPVAIPGAKPRAVLTMLGLHGGSVVGADTLVELLWGDDPPRTAGKALQTHISALRRALGDGFVVTQGSGWVLGTAEVDATRYKTAAALGRSAMTSGNAHEAVTHFDEALALWRGVPELPDGRRGTSEQTRWVEEHAALVEDRADALLATGRAAELIGELEAAIADAPLRERRWGHLMLALYRAGRQGEALAGYRRVRQLLADELGIDPGPELRRLEAAIVAQDISLEPPVAQHHLSIMRAVTFLLTDIEGSTAAWEQDADAMAVALARHDEIVEHVVTFRGGRLIKTRGEGDATFSVFDRPSAAAAAAIDVQEAMRQEPWELAEPMRVRVALHTGEVEFRDGDYFGRAVNRAARLRALAVGGQILCSGATAELAIDTLADDVVLVDLGSRQLKNLVRPEHVFELRLSSGVEARAPIAAADLERPALPAVLAGPGPFVGRGGELERLLTTWQASLTAGACAVLIAGEPGVGKTRLAGEWSRRAHEEGAVVLYGRCDEDLGAPYQPFAEAMRVLVPCLGSTRLRELRGVEALLPLVPGLVDLLPDVAAPPRADADTERYALFDAVVGLLGIASRSAPVVVVLDDLHWAAKPTLLLLRHLLRFGEHARVQIVATYRSTDLDRSHPLAAMLADLNRDGSADRLQLGGLENADVTAYVAASGYDDEDLARALASVTGGNPFFLIEALRHVDESGGHWDPSTLPQGVREAVSRRLSRLPAETNKALAAAAVVGSRFDVDLVERVVEQDLVDAFDEASKAGILIEEPGGRYRFNHALVRQSLLTELASVRRMRLHQRIAAALEADARDDQEMLAELAHHYFECAWAGNAAKAVDYCRRAGEQAMARLAYEGAADLYDKALHALEELDDDPPDREGQQGELLIARCEALLAAGEVGSASGAVSQLRRAAGDSGRLAAWATCFDGQLTVLTDPGRLDEIESAVGSAAAELAELDDAAGEAKAHTVRAACLGRLGRIADCETALDRALTAARRSHEHRRVNAVLANAPLAALWGPNPVPRAGGRCLDVVRLLRITTGSPVVEAASTRCQAVLDAFRGRASAGRQLIDSARRALTELGMRHALLEVEQFAGIIELVAADPAAAERHLRLAYHGFRRMGLDADTAEAAALLARACLELDRYEEADELCTESADLSGHAFRASIAWRTVRAQLLARSGAHDEARRVADEAIVIAERTDALADHGDACLALATVLNVAGDSTAAGVAVQRAVELYELKGAAALAERARALLGQARPVSTTAESETPLFEPNNSCVRAGRRMVDAVERRAWDEVELLLAPALDFESRRKVVGTAPLRPSSTQWQRAMERYFESGLIRYQQRCLAVRGDHLAIFTMSTSTDDVGIGAPVDEFLVVGGLDADGRICLQVWFDVEDMDVALTELDAHFTQEQRTPPLENDASRLDQRFNVLFGQRLWDDAADLWVDDVRVEDRRRGLRREVNYDRATGIADIRALSDVGVQAMTSDVVAIRGDRLALCRTRYTGRDQRPNAFHTDILRLTELDVEGRCAISIAFDADDLDGAFAELEARYVAGEAAAHAGVWSTVTGAYASFNRGEPSAMTQGFTSIDHRRGASFAPGDLLGYLLAAWADSPGTRIQLDAVHRLSSHGVVVTHSSKGMSQEGFDAEWRDIAMIIVNDGVLSCIELFDDSDLDAAVARFDEMIDAAPAGLEELGKPASPSPNAACRGAARFNDALVARDWAGMERVFAPDVRLDDRRRLVGAAFAGRDDTIANMKASAETGVKSVTRRDIAVRGNRLVLQRVLINGRDNRPEAFRTETLAITEVDAENLITAFTLFDANDPDAAFAELENRYCAGEAEPHASTWSLVAEHYAAINRRELPATTTDWVNLDHRRVPTIETGEMLAHLSASWDLAPELLVRIEEVHQLDDLGAVVTVISNGRSADGFVAEWRMVHIVTFIDDLISRCEIFDDTDIDQALARFDEIEGLAARLANGATRVWTRLVNSFNRRALDEFIALSRPDGILDDRRKGVRDVQGGSSRLRVAQTLFEYPESWRVQVAHLAVRGERLVLSHLQLRDFDDVDRSVTIEYLTILEVDECGLAYTFVNLDIDDLDAAVTELDVRYQAGEAIPHAQTFAAVTGVFDAINRREMPSTSPEFIDVDHRRVAVIEAGGLKEYLAAGFNDMAGNHLYVESIHRLNDVGAVVTHVAKGRSLQGLDVEWRLVDMLTIDGGLLGRCELFDEADLNLALVRFDELSASAPGLENAATWAMNRCQYAFATHDWAGLAEVFAHDVTNDDRRRIVGVGVLHGRDAAAANLRAVADIGVKGVALTVLATRGSRLALLRSVFEGNDKRPDAFRSESLLVTEVNAEQKVCAFVVYDLDDLDAAFGELDSRYLAGEAAAHAETWRLVIRTYAAFNRRELSTTTPDWVNIDHRRGVGSAPGDMNAYVSSLWPLVPDIQTRIVAVHRLSDAGAVFTHTETGRSQKGFDAEWREVALLTFDGDAINRCELFDEPDLGAALAQFDGLKTPPPMENAATTARRRMTKALNRRDLGGVLEQCVANGRFEDRRKGLRDEAAGTGLATVVRALFDVTSGWLSTTNPVAMRGSRLTVTRDIYCDLKNTVVAEHLTLTEVGFDGLICYSVLFDPDDVDAAFAELDSRYLAGEAAPHGRAWQVITDATAAFNRHEAPATTPDSINVDHRHVTPFSQGDFFTFANASDVILDVRRSIEAVHLLSDLGAVVTGIANGTTDAGFDAEWRAVVLATINGDLISRYELFDEADLDEALARFAELDGSSTSLVNAASRAAERFVRFPTGDWDAVADMFAPDFRQDDRRRVVGAGVRHGRAAEIDDLRAFTELGLMNVALTVLGIRGERLVMSRGTVWGGDSQANGVHTEMLVVTEVDADGQIAALVIFDFDDLDAAFDELDARYLAGEAGPHAQTWSQIVDIYAAFNRREVPTTTPDWVNVDHRLGVSSTASDMDTYVHELWSMVPDARTRIEAVHRLDDFGAVLTSTSSGRSTDGFAAEWKMVHVFAFDGAVFSRCEMFDEADLDAALAHFDELS